tara:strand:+ start:1798 stop:2367 length:570 start_codon:yes stop_codon:yes gene_type:complete
MTIFIFTISLAAGVVLLVLSLLSLWRPQVQFWPPPGVGTWQYKLFWWLFRVFFVGVVLVCMLDFGGIGSQHSVQLIAGISLATTGFGLAFYVTFQLGWRDAHGEAKCLNTSGFYKWSRNPIYVVTIVGMAGLGLLTHSWFVYCLLSIWSALYVVAAYLEELWLEQQYGDEYRAYKSEVSRFLGRHHLKI